MHPRTLLTSKVYHTIIVTVVLVSSTPCFSKLIKDNSTMDASTMSLIPARSIAEEEIAISRRTKAIRHRRRTEEQSRDNSICPVPKLNPFLPEIMKFDVPSPKEIRCPGEDYVKCYLSKCRVVDEKKVEGLSDFHCTYTDIIYKTDMFYNFGRSTAIKGTGEYTLNASDHVYIQCRIRDNHSKSVTWWKGFGWGLRSSFKPPVIPKGRENAINVVMIGFDTVSHNHFIRKMPKSYEYLKNVIGATFLNGYNVLGDGTVAALFPLLSGKFEVESPQKYHFVDHKPFIFHQIKKYGYRTAYFEDFPIAGTFQYSLPGFRVQLADHYAWPFYQAVLRSKLKHIISQSCACVGDTASHKLLMNLTDQVLQMEGKNFVVTFSGEVSHEDINVLGAADENLFDFLTDVLTNGHLNNTLLIVFSDHGPRFAKYRNTFVGKLEERLPLMSIRLPEVLRQRRPEAQVALESNIDALTTAFDVHATILDAMDLRELWNPYRVRDARQTRALTLLKQVPRTRSCREAGISPHWCTCQNWNVVLQSDPIYERVGKAFVDAVNNYTEFQRPICTSRELESIEWVKQLGSNHKSYVNYQVKLTLNPKKAMYEATLTYDTKLKIFYADITQISRINAYGDESHCVLKRYPHLLKFCYCRDNYKNM